MGKGKRNREARSQPYQMSRAESKAMKREINNQILKSDAEYYYDMDACVLWALHEVFGFGYTRLKRFFDVLNAICVEDLGFAFNGSGVYGLQLQDVDKALKARVLGDILEPEFNEEQPKRLLPRVWFRYRRWQANRWKQRLCYNESRRSAFWSGVWNHLLRPSSI